MNQQLFNYIRHLSKQDRKTLSQKALKTCEEVGELAKVVLPFDNAFATTHRFTERERILEEAVDTVLCALSVAYDLDFTNDEIEEMVERKSEKWAALQRKENSISYPLPYEIHVTVNMQSPLYVGDAIDNFKMVCGNINVKPIVLDLESLAGEVKMVDVMTSSKHFGTNTSAYAEVMRITNQLTAAGYQVVRQKVETVPWHPAAPTESQPMPPNCYFESHVPVLLTSDRVEELRAYMVRYNDIRLHLSRNPMKRNQDGTIVQMITLRSSTGNLSEFQSDLDLFVDYLSRRWTLGKIIVEFSVYDTKVSHDASWIRG